MIFTFLILNENVGISNKNSPKYISSDLVIKKLAFVQIMTWLRPDAKPHLNLWWRHQMETLSALLAICAGNSPVTGEFPAQRPVTRSFDVFFVLRLDRQLSKPWGRWWFWTPSRSLWRHWNAMMGVIYVHIHVALDHDDLTHDGNPSKLVVFEHLKMIFTKV